MDFEWDEAKASSNFDKHGVDFHIVFELDWETAIVVSDLRFDYGEPRFVAYGRVADGTGFVVAFTFRGLARRIISVRRFGRKELEIYGR